MKAHLKTIATPSTWKLKRKKHKFVIRPNPGKRMIHSMPLGLVLRILKHANTSKELKYLLTSKEVLVDGKKRKDIKYPVGIMDIVSIPELKENHKMLINKKNQIYFENVDGKDAGTKPSRITGKKMHKGKIQLTFYDGRTMLLDITEGKNYMVGDSLTTELPSGKILKHSKLQKGAKVLLIGGKNIGTSGTVENVEGKTIFVKSGERTLSTLKKYAYVLG